MFGHIHHDMLNLIKKLTICEFGVAGIPVSRVVFATQTELNWPMVSRDASIANRIGYRYIESHTNDKCIDFRV